MGVKSIFDKDDMIAPKCPISNEKVKTCTTTQLYAITI
jgi:hypothetical protein